MAWWQPDPQTLEQVANLLASGQRADVDQQRVLEQLQKYKLDVNFNNYLAYIFWADDIKDISVRTSAGLLLKNNVMDACKQNVDNVNVDYIKAGCLSMLRSEVRALRQTAGTLVASLLSRVTLDSWPDLVHHVLHALDSGSPGVQEGALSMLYKIAEEFGYQLDITIVAFNAKPSNLFMPKVAALFTSSSPDVKHAAVRVINIMSQTMPDWLVDNVDAYANSLLRLAQENGEPRLQKEVCLGITQLLQARPDALQAHLSDFLAYIMLAMQHSEQEVALEATEFWGAYMDCELPTEPLLPILGNLVALLLTFMVFDEYDDEVQNAEAAEHAQPHETEAELRPFFGHNSSGPAEADDSESGGEATPRDGGSSEWTLRKSCANTLDHLSHEFPDKLLEFVLPVVVRYLKDDNWRLREAAILALGAVAEGCRQGLEPHIPAIFTMLLDKLKDPQPMVRINSCWTLGRFSHWALHPAAAPAPPTDPALARSILYALMERMREHNSCVHYAACSGLSAFFEAVKTARESEAGWAAAESAALDAEAPAIVAHLMSCLPAYTRKNVRQLYETLTQLVEALPICTTSADIVRAYMEPLLAKLSQMHDLDRETIPLIDAIIVLSSSLDSNLEPYAPTLLQRALSLSRNGVSVMAAGSANGASATMQEIADNACKAVVFALDLIAGLCESLRHSMQALLASLGGSAVVELSVECASGKAPNMRQSAFALVGDLATYCASYLQPRANDLLRLCSEQLDGDHINEDEINACNNACWALGLMVKNLSVDVTSPFVLPAAARIAAVLRGDSMVYKRLSENAAISMGYLACIAPASLAPHADQFLGQWCNMLRMVRDGPEKEAAFGGLLSVLSCNTASGLACFSSLCHAVGSWDAPPPALQSTLQQMMHAYKAQLEGLGQWSAALESIAQTCSPMLVDKLTRMYAL